MAFPWLINGGDPNYLLSGMILQVVSLPLGRYRMGRIFNSHRHVGNSVPFVGERREWAGPCVFLKRYIQQNRGKIDLLVP